MTVSKTNPQNLKNPFFTDHYFDVKLEALGERPPIEYLTGFTMPTPRMEEYEDMFTLEDGDEEITPQCDLENPETCESCQ